MMIIQENKCIYVLLKISTYVVIVIVVVVVDDVYTKNNSLSPSLSIDRLCMGMYVFV